MVLRIGEGWRVYVRYAMILVDTSESLPRCLEKLGQAKPGREFQRFRISSNVSQNFNNLSHLLSNEVWPVLASIRLDWMPSNDSKIWSNFLIDEARNDIKACPKSREKSLSFCGWSNFHDDLQLNTRISTHSPMNGPIYCFDSLNGRELWDLSWSHSSINALSSLVNSASVT